MAEYIEREALIKELSNSVEPFNTGSVFRTIKSNQQLMLPQWCMGGGFITQTAE